ncbi:amino acid/polyamine transporter I [Geopyxis carbonaria]|nr:amino acid/polyamine transporter I [Geopyxis carbonaria]
MADEKEVTTQATLDSNTSAQEDGFNANVDDARLAEMGYQAELSRSFSLLSCLAVGFSISNSWFGVTGALVTGISNGGPVIYMYGSILMALIHVAVGASLGELASAYPNSGGQYYWVMKLAPKSTKRFLSYLTGVVSWAGAMITGASVSLVLGQGIVGMIILGNPNIVYERWMGFVAYQICNVLIFFLNCYDRWLPGLSKASLYISLLSMVIITISVLAVSPTKQPAEWVWKGYTNNSGWKSEGINFITGLLGVNWGFSCLDACTHLAEEIPRPERNVPKAILGTVAIGFLSSWIYCIALFFSIQDVDGVIGTSTFVPNLELFYQALRGNLAGTIILELLVLLTAAGCLMSIHTWQSRLMWAFARDHGFPCSGTLSKVASSPYNVPLWSHLVSSICIAVLGCVYLGSSTGFYSLVTGCILMQYISYIIPVGLLMLNGRRFPAGDRAGPFWLGAWGWLANAVLVVWVSIALVIYSFPYVMPVLPDNMNYVTVVMAVILLYACVYWVGWGRKTFSGVEKMG